MAKKVVATVKVTKIENPFKLSRKTWGDMSPVTRVVKSKRAYTRKDKSWKKDF